MRAPQRNDVSTHHAAQTLANQNHTSRWINQQHSLRRFLEGTIVFIALQHNKSKHVVRHHRRRGVITGTAANGTTGRHRHRHAAAQQGVTTCGVRSRADGCRGTRGGQCHRSRAMTASAAARCQERWQHRGHRAEVLEVESTLMEWKAHHMTLCNVTRYKN